jgi:hypothetical protein
LSSWSRWTPSIINRFSTLLSYSLNTAISSSRLANSLAETCMPPTVTWESRASSFWSGSSCVEIEAKLTMT